MSATDHLLYANKKYVETFAGPRPLKPKLRTTIIECMDSRIDTYGALGLNLGDAHILRNAGGVITDDVLRSLALSQRELGTCEVIILHHTGCGLTGFDDAAFRAQLEAESGVRPGWDVPGFTDVEARVRESVDLVRNCKWIPNRDSIRGFVFNTETAEMTEVN